MFERRRSVCGRPGLDGLRKIPIAVDEVSMLGMRTLYAANERLCKLCGSAEDFGGIPVVVFYRDFC